MNNIRIGDEIELSTCEHLGAIDHEVIHHYMQGKMWKVIRVNRHSIRIEAENGKSYRLAKCHPEDVKLIKTK